MNVGIFIAGAFVTLIVSASMGLLVWGFWIEARANAREREAVEAGDEASLSEAVNEIRHPGPHGADGRRQPEPQGAETSKGTS